MDYGSFWKHNGRPMAMKLIFLLFLPFGKTAVAPWLENWG
jgi:hypothetical protein